MPVSKEMTDREAYLLTKALCVASRALRAQMHPPFPDIEEMEEMAKTYYPDFYKVVQQERIVGRALKAGYKFKGRLDMDVIQKWLDENFPEDADNVLRFENRLRLNRE